MTPFDQQCYSCRCEWGVDGVDHLAVADVVIVVDVFSFSTTVDIAVGRGAFILPYAWRDASAALFAQRHGAELAGPRSPGRYSLSPTSFVGAPAGLRCVVPSRNGAAAVLRAATMGAVVLTGCLRNASAVAAAARSLGSTFNVVPAGERWPDNSLRPALEDWLAAGAILRCLPGTKSPEAAAAIAAFESAQDGIAARLAACSSGSELLAGGFPQDVEVAAAFDVSKQAPRYDGVGFVGTAMAPE